jgi:formate dehydrogenase beta subunit
MGMHEWSYKNEYNGAERRLVPHVGLIERFKKVNVEVECKPCSPRNYYALR